MNSWIKILRINQSHKCKAAVRIHSMSRSISSIWATWLMFKGIRAKQPIFRIPKTLWILIWLMRKCSIVSAGRQAHLMGMECIQLIDWTIEITNVFQTKQRERKEPMTLISITVSEISQEILSSLYREMKCSSPNFRKLNNCGAATRPMSLDPMKTEHLKNRMILIWPS